MPFAGFPEFVTDAMAVMGLSRTREDGTQDPHAERIWQIAAQSQATRQLGSLLGQAADGTNVNSLATLSVARQHLAALRVTAYAAAEALASVERELGLASPDDDSDDSDEPRPTIKLNHIKKRARRNNGTQASGDPNGGDGLRGPEIQGTGGPD